MLKLAKLPDRTPVKITIAVSPGLSHMLLAYARLYTQHYGNNESVADLVPFMLESFLKGDRSFAKARKSEKHIKESIKP